MPKVSGRGAADVLTRVPEDDREGGREMRRLATHLAEREGYRYRVLLESGSTCCASSDMQLLCPECRKVVTGQRVPSGRDYSAAAAVPSPPSLRAAILAQRESASREKPRTAAARRARDAEIMERVKAHMRAGLSYDHMK
jgi:hypothetical protein